jgi:malate permease and related proteins
VIAIAATIAASVAVGVGAERRWGEQAQAAARNVLTAALYTLVPFVVFFNVARLDLDVNVGVGLLLAYVMLACVALLAWLVADRILRLGRPATGAVIASVLQVNTGFVGLPLTATLLGAGSLSEAVAYDSAVTVPILFGPVFAIGAAFGSRAGEGFRERTRAFFLRNPPLLALVAALIVPDVLAPDVLVDASRVLVFAFVPIGFFAVGVTLAAEAEEGALPFPPAFGAPVATAVVLRLLVAPALLLALAAPLIDLPDPYLLLSAMPTGINTLVVAHVYGLDLKIAAGAIAWSTTIVVLAGLVAALA